MLRRCLLLVCVVVLATVAPGYPATRPPGSSLEIGLLLVAIDAQRDHVRISEGLRISNPGSPVTRELRVILPDGAVYATFHRGLAAPRETPGGFADTVRFATGITEVAYSYALPAGADLTLTRTFPLRARRIEVVVRGAGVALEVRGGTGLAPLRLGDEALLRGELLDVPAGSAVTIRLRGLPVTRRWLPAAIAGVLAAVLAAGLILALRRGLASDGKNFTH